jgi:hypothetical protein
MGAIGAPVGAHGPSAADPTVSDLYWYFVSPLVHSPGGRLALITILTGLIVFAPAFLPRGPLSFNVVP